MLSSSVPNPSSPAATSIPVATPDERRPWTYPDVWDGVKWMPTPRRTRPALDWDARPMIHAVGRLFACALVGTSLFMSAVTLAAVAAIALGGA